MNANFFIIYIQKHFPNIFNYKVFIKSFYDKNCRKHSSFRDQVYYAEQQTKKLKASSTHPRQSFSSIVQVNTRRGFSITYEGQFFKFSSKANQKKTRSDDRLYMTSTGRTTRNFHHTNCLT